MFGWDLVPGGQVVPGNPEELFSLASQLRIMGERLNDVAAEIAAIGPEGWRGPAAAAFEGVLAEQPSRYREAGTAFLGASSSVMAYAEALASAQQVTAATTGFAAPPGPIPGGEGDWAGGASPAATTGNRAETWARCQLDAVHEDLANGARKAVHALRAQGDQATYGLAGSPAVAHARWAAGEQLQFAETLGGGAKGLEPMDVRSSPGTGGDRAGDC